MAAQSKALAKALSKPGDAPGPQAKGDAYEELRRVHDEATETARLANLLGRTLPAAVLIEILAGATLLIARAATTRAASFAILVSMGAVALLYSYAKTGRTAFVRANLRAFASDLDATMLYLGFAWGAGAFLILPANADAATAVLYSACVPALIAMVLRKREPVLMFAAPAALMTAGAAFIRPLSFPALTATMAIVACGIVAGTVVLAARMKERGAFGMADSRAA